MNEYHAEKLTPELTNAELEIEDTRVKLLDSALASLSIFDEEKMQARLKQVVVESMRELFRAVPQWNIIPETQMLPTRIRVLILTSEESKRYYGKVNPTIVWGMVMRGRTTIGLIKHLGFAPTEVIKSVTVHECLHILYPLAKKVVLNIRDSIQRGYPPEHYQEEEWVTRMTERLCGKDDLLLGWKVSVDARGMQWKEVYYKLKKSKILRREANYSSYDS